MSLQKNVKKIVRATEKQGWTAKEKKDGWMMLSPDGKGAVVLHKTPSDWRTLRNDIARMRRYGFR